jgi:hypothetical protein
MFPRTAGLLVLFTVLSACSAELLCHAQQPQQTPVRYHLGDDPKWADANFDDSSWPVAQNGLVPSRSRDTDRFLWVRLRVPVPGKLNGPVALHLDDEEAAESDKIASEAGLRSRFRCKTKNSTPYFHISYSLRHTRIIRKSWRPKCPRSSPT